MIEDLREIFSEKCNIPAGERILVGVSGGVDSMALMSALHEAGYSIVVGHLDHGLRDVSEDEGVFVRSEAEKLGVEFHSGRVDAAVFASENKFNVEEAARELRYQFLFRLAEENNCRAVAVGHHADDQAETILLNLVRGSGLKGLGGMAHHRLTQWHPVIPLVRPLLDVPRNVLEAYCAQNGVPSIEDASNQDVSFRRNRIRHEVLPILKEMNPKLVNSLGKIGILVRDELDTLEKVTDHYWGEINGENSGEVVWFSRDKFLNLERSLRRRLMRKAFGILRPGLNNVGFDLIERAVDAVGSPPESRELDLAQGIKLEIRKDSVRMSAWGTTADLSGYPQLDGELSLRSSEDGVYPIGRNWVLRLSRIKEPDLEEIIDNSDPFTAYLDLEEGSGLLLVRPRKAGDRISPLGMGGQRMKVSDLMINEVVPREAREHWPLIDYGGMIVWVPGCRSAEDVKVGPESGPVVKLVLKRLP